MNSELKGENGNEWLKEHNLGGLYLRLLER
jgi:hypothetical protein